MIPLHSLTRLFGVESALWISQSGDIEHHEGIVAQDEVQLMMIAQCCASIAMAMADLQPDTEEIFLRFSGKSLYSRQLTGDTLLVVCQDTIHLATLRAAVRKLLQEPTTVQAATKAPPAPKPPTKTKRTRTGIWG